MIMRLQFHWNIAHDSAIKNFTEIVIWKKNVPFLGLILIGYLHKNYFRTVIPTGGKWCYLSYIIWFTSKTLGGSSAASQTGGQQFQL